ncbi:type II secretion system F family protein [bacterium]|nr:type II secretion system F family protein [bacterium]
MPDFEYQGVDRAGKRVNGVLSATSDGELRMMLRAQGVRPTKISKRGAVSTPTSVTITRMLRKTAPDSRGYALSLKQKLLFTRQLQLMISSGIPLVQGLEILADQSSDPLIRRMLEELKDKVSQGSFFWESLATYPRTFSKIYIALIRAGETSGSLDIVLKRLTRYLEDAERIRKMVVGALTYPVIVFLIGLGVMTAMLVFVIPKFEEMLRASKTELPAITAAVVGASHFVSENWIALFGVLGFAVFALNRFVKTHEGKAVLDRFLFTMPLFGTLVQKGAIAAFTRTLQTLLGAGVNLVDAVDIARTTVDNVVISDEIAKIRGEVEAGKSLSAVISGMTVFPKMATQMISVGEVTGNLDKMLEKVADFYEAEVESVVGQMGRVIEPLILVVLGGLVAGMLLAMYMPMFQMAGGAGG